MTKKKGKQRKISDLNKNTQKNKSIRTVPKHAKTIRISEVHIKILKKFGVDIHSVCRVAVSQVAVALRKLETDETNPKEIEKTVYNAMKYIDFEDALYIILEELKVKKQNEKQNNSAIIRNEEWYELMDKYRARVNRNTPNTEVDTIEQNKEES